MKALLIVLLLGLLGACGAGSRTQYRGGPTSPCAGARPYAPPTAFAATAPCRERRL